MDQETQMRFHVRCCPRLSTSLSYKERSTALSSVSALISRERKEGGEQKYTDLVVDGGDTAEEGLPLVGRGRAAHGDGSAAVSPATAVAGRRRRGGCGNRRGYGAHRLPLKSEAIWEFSTLAAAAAEVCIPGGKRGLGMDLGSCNLGGNADAVEFCPHRPFRHILAAATYTLQEQAGEEQQQDRAGTVSLFSVDAGADDESRRLRLLHTVETAGVFDMKWSPTEPLLAQADAHGRLVLRRLEQEDGSEEGVVLTDVCAGDVSSSMCLYVDWNQNADSLSVGLSDGSLSVISMREDRLEVSEQWTAHQYEVWTCYFDRARPNVLYSGSDDCSFSCWDLRESPSNIVFRNKKSHTMGVCCITQNPLEGNMLLTGSYDEYLRVWDMRSMVKPVNEKSLNLGGGVWRIKYHPRTADVILAACMHNGFAIVKVGTGDATVMETYCKHESLAYGADWQTSEVAEHNTYSSVIATCSFYDRLLRVWQPENLVNHPSKS